MPRITKQGLRGFAAGILFSVAVLSFAYYNELPNQATSAQPESVQKNDPTSQPIKEIQIPQAASGSANAGQPSQANPPAQPEKKLYTYRLVIEKGMSPEEASKKLQEAHIISDQRLLVKYLNDFSLMGSVRYGTYDLNSDMKIPEIAQIITKAKAK
ncbi:hypothetical protein [Aneurinibacillus aneurinilyticus]|uniref:Endolytic transglycosylase MltG n=2 Tax=Aneurinibacillus aneurinilyticus TaxID=1391 RepID=A0A848D148_ANEAE|nr:hypothetical protein [Aneurinibacillus aneurinilyticus]ERI04074.1 hypothetical protein HMPREF0083_06192 [Aneurinibacillus aneurinilyticus ATCC 12856]MCI1692471.1 hypothetical protein [Aneurinibacillus aneurinilyticus]MED0673424.1 hypothetical protein [Aneurinibacillus aneurinilyticus]MED0707844.1 hypothetical protein [Aneurinibacillus aneurinilyticus]MED0722969.1 hypothetical protein [Aneurinibacillus aneurinilyticus]